MLYYKFDVLPKLKEAGYSSYELRQQKLISEAQVAALRHRKMIGRITLDTICRLLHCQPGDVIGWQEDDSKMSP